jgi:hypothetical protein
MFRKDTKNYDALALGLSGARVITFATVASLRLAASYGVSHAAFA